MALSTPSSSTSASRRVNVDDADLVALLCAASAGVHGALVVPHAGVSTRGLAVDHLLSRTGGIPGLTEHPEPFDTLGVTVSLVEVAAAVGAVRLLNPRRNR